MDAKPKFNVIYSEEVIDFLNSLPAKTKAKIMFNVGKARYNLDPKLFKKLVGTDIWEFRTLYNGLQYRLLAFWDNNTNTYVINVSSTNSMYASPMLVLYRKLMRN